MTAPRSPKSGCRRAAYSQSDISIHTARSIIGYEKILGVSTHNITQARLAQQEGAGYISVGPLFYTATKDYEPAVGLDYLKQVKSEITIPLRCNRRH